MSRVLDSIRGWQICVVIALAGIIVYGKSAAYDFTGSDDTQLIVWNHDVLSNLANLPKVFEKGVFNSITRVELFYRPALTFLFMLEMQISGTSPLVYHITNILLHLGCCVLLYLVFRQLRCSKEIAGLASLLFCIHPLNSSAVVWIPGRNDTLLALFILGSFLLLLRALETKRVAPLFGHFVLFFLALLTKETAIVFPILSVSYIFLFHRSTPSRARWVFGILAYCVLIGGWYWMRSFVPETYAVHVKNSVMLMSWFHNLPALFLYLGKMMFPFNMSISPNLMDNSVLPGILATFLFVVLIVISRPSHGREIIWGIAWFILFIVPTFVAGNIFHEHRAYCAFFGILFALIQLPIVKSLDLSRTPHVLVAVGVCALFAVVAMVHSEHFRNRTAYFTSAYLSSPSLDYSYAGLAELFIDEGKEDDAEVVLRKGLERNLNFQTTHRMLGDILAHRGDYAGAAQEYDISLKLNPTQLYTYISYGAMCLNAGRPDDAARLWKRSVLVNPEFLLGYEYLANYYLHVRNDPDSAAMYVDQVRRRGVTAIPELLHRTQKDPVLNKKTTK